MTTSLNFLKLRLVPSTDKRTSKAVWVLVLAVLLMITAAGCSSSGDGSGPAKENTWADNVMMSDHLSETYANRQSQSSVFGTGIMRKEVGSISVLDSLDSAPDDALDISEAQNGSVLLWFEKNGELYDLHIGGEGGVSAPADCAELFAYYTNVTSVNFNGSFHTENTTTMRSMFAWNSNTTTLDVSGFDTAQVTDMSSLFENCSSAAALDVEGWDTSNVQSIYSMFFDCDELTSLDLNRWNTSALTDLRSAFQACDKLENLSVEQWDVSHVTSIDRTFMGCRQLTSLDLSGWDLFNAETADCTFQYCAKLTSLTVGEGWDLASMNDTADTFAKCAISGPTNVIVSADAGSSGGNSAIGNDSVGSGDTSGKATEVAKPLESTSFIPDGAVFPDLASYAGEIMKFETVDKHDKTLFQKLKCDLDDYHVLEAYVDHLVKNYDFKLVETPYYKYFKSNSSRKTFFDFVLKYTGPVKLTGDQQTGFSKSASGDLRIYGVAESGVVEGQICYNNSLTSFDDGKRHGSSGVSTALAGDSASAGLLRLRDGSYQTSDGKLTAAVGETAVLSGSDSKTYSGRFEQVSGKHQAILAEDKNGTERLRIRFPHTKELAAGQIYTGADLADDNSFVLDDGMQKHNNPFNMSTFYVLHNGTYYSAVPGLSGEIERLNLRIMHWEEDKEAVFYVGIQFESAPYEEEYLIAVSLGPETVSSGSSSGGSSSSGVPSSGTSTTKPRTRCTFPSCDGGKVDCNVCGGDGGREVYDSSTPQYDGVGSGTNKWDWKDCSSCSGGKVSCDRCGGDGWMD